MSAQNLVKYISQHSIDAYLGSNGRIYALQHYAYADSQWVVIEPTMDAVRNWLGY